MKKKIEFHGIGEDSRKFLIKELLSRHFEIEECTGGKGDYLFSDTLAYDHVKYDKAVKIAVIGENTAPDFNWFDYAIGFDRLEFADRYLRLPLYVFYRGDYLKLAGRLADDGTSAGQDNRRLVERKFCSFVVSAANGNPIRRKFFEELSKYKQVDSGGRWMNNVGGPVKDKAVFLREHKFNIAFENSSHPGYVTEKLMQAFAAQTVPIYFGAPDVELDFNREAMIVVKDENDIKRAVEEVIALDKDDKAYLAKVTAPCRAANLEGVYEKQLEEFLVHVVSQPLALAKRRNDYGYQSRMRKTLTPLLCVYQFVRELAWKMYALVR